MDFTFGMRVVGSDGTEAGQLDHVLLNPATREVTHVVVRSPEVSEDLLLPLSLLQGNTDHELLLHLGSGELEDMPRYYEGRTSSPPAGRVDTAPIREPAEGRADLETALDVPPNARQYGPETRVRTSDDREGRLAGLAADHYANRLSVLRVRGIGPQDLLVQERWAADLGADEIAVSAPSDRLERYTGPAVGSFVSRQSGTAREVEERSGPG